MSEELKRQLDRQAAGVYVRHVGVAAKYTTSALVDWLYGLPVVVKKKKKKRTYVIMFNEFN